MKSARQILVGGMLAAAVMAVAHSAWTQQINGTPGSPDATQVINGNQIPAPPLPFGGVIKENVKDSKPYWPPPVVPPKGAPNILLIMTDDQGYGISSTFGGVIPTPSLDRVAKAGLRIPPRSVRPRALRLSPGATIIPLAPVLSANWPPAIRATIPSSGWSALPSVKS